MYCTVTLNTFSYTVLTNHKSRLRSPKQRAPRLRRRLPRLRRRLLRWGGASLTLA